MTLRARFRYAQWAGTVLSIALACADEPDAPPPTAPREAGPADSAVALDAGADDVLDAKSDVPDPALSIGKPCTAGTPSACPTGLTCRTTRCSGAGTCQLSTALCRETRIVGGVCGCDGRVYESACEAYRVDVDIGPATGCATPEGRLLCGNGFCHPATQYCCEFSPSQPGWCRLLPAACQNQPTPDCACLANPQVCRVIPGPTPGLGILCPPD